VRKIRLIWVDLDVDLVFMWSAFGFHFSFGEGNACAI